MAATPAVVVFDVNETLSDMTPMAQRFADIGAPPLLAKVWFASLLRDGFALTAAGGKEKFATVGETVLRTLLADIELDRDGDAAISHVLSGFLELPTHADVVSGIRALRAARLRLVTLTNGSTEVADRLLTEAGVRGEFESLLSVEDAPAWKPAQAAYEYAARMCGNEIGELLLVAVHPWDINGAARAGMSTAWINRGGQQYPSYFAAPDHTVVTLTDLASRLAA